MIDYREEFIRGRVINKGFDEGLRIYMLKIYSYMALALLTTTGMSLATLIFKPLTRLMYNITSTGYIYGITGFGVIIQFVPLIIAFGFAFGIVHMSIGTAKILMWIYAASMGMSLSSLGLVYTGESLVLTFFICSSLFGVMSLYGYLTKKDLTQTGSFLVMGLFGLVLASLVNIFVQSSAITFATSFVGIGIFMGLTAWDTQMLKEIYYYHSGSESGQKAAIMGAFSLYLDFINLFLALLNFFSSKRDK